jgi:arylsulfatase A-like enzyme
MSAPRAARVIVFGFDGLRPDMLHPDVTPNILRVVGSGIRFANSRSVFPSETRVATPSFATGCRPASHGLVGNQMFDAGVGRVLNTKNASDIDALVSAHGSLLQCPSLGARLAASGRRLAVVWTGTVGAARCMFPEADALGAIRWQPDDPNRFAAALAAATPVPAADVPNTARVRFAARLLIEKVLPGKPDVAVFWSSEPDVSFHYAGIGSDVARQALREADACLGEVLAWRQFQPDAADIAVIVMSDHGHVTGEARIALEAALQGGGFHVAKDLSAGAIALGGGGAPGLWVRGRDPALIARLAAWLQAQDFVRLVLAREPGGMDGVLPLAPLGATHARAADLAFVFAGGPGADRYGLPGHCLIEAADVPAGGGMHGGLHLRELATVLAIAVPGLHAGAVSDTPCDLTDIAPTILALLGLPHEGTDGVPLAEAWTGTPPPFTRESRPAHAGRVLNLFHARGRIYPDAAG